MRSRERELKRDSGIDNLIEASIATEANKWYNVLQCIINVILFLGERGLALHGTSQMIGDENNG